MTAADLPRRHSAAGAFAHRGFALYWGARLLSTFATHIVSVAVGWQVYDLTRDPLDLGIVGLVQFVPALALVLVTGPAADRFSRRWIMGLCIVGEMACAAILLGLTIAGLAEVWPIFAVLLGFGVARAFYGPAAQSLVPNLVPEEDLASAVSLTTMSWQIAAIVGPVAGGLLYGVSPEAGYWTAMAMLLAAAVLTAMIPPPPQAMMRESADAAMLVAGFRYVWTNRLVLGAISLDLFAVLFGGAVALMPVYARDILDVGPWGLGLLRSAPGVGALLMALWLVRYPIHDRAGTILFVSVGAFGAATIVFGLSTITWLSVAALALMGASDMVSVYVRETLIQLATPDAVRGRVNAINMVFIGASNEVGEFRAGVSAALIGVVPAVALGGLCTVGVTALWAAWFPELRRARRLDGH